MRRGVCQWQRTQTLTGKRTPMLWSGFHARGVMLGRSRADCLVGLIILVFAACAPAGMINISGQTRFVDVTTQGVPDVGVPPADRRQDANDFLPFNASVNLNFPPVT